MTDTQTGRLPAADLERRFTAFAVDRLLGWGVAAGVAAAAWQLGGTSVWVALLVFAGTAVLLGIVTAVLLGTTGLTPAKAMLGLRVVRQSDGAPIGVGPALTRVLVLGVAGLPTLGLGAATLGWTAAMDPDRRRRGLHDRFGDAIVVDVRPRPAEDDDHEEQPQQLVNLTAMRLLPSPPEPTTPAHGTPVAPTPPAAAVPPAAAAPPQAAPPQVPPPVAPPQAPPTAPPVPARSGGSHRADVPASQPAPPAQDGSLPPLTRIPAPPHPPEVATQLREAAAATRWQVSFDTGETFEVRGLAIVGRRPEPRPGEPVTHVVPLPSTDMSLSKTHAQFQVAPDGALVVMDRGSTNGSYVVRRGMSRTLTAGRPSTLLDGDVVRFGDRTMTVTRL